jgi:hypothetical protein
MTIGSVTTNEVLRGLPVDLVETLALLHDAPGGMAESTIALLPYGSRSALAAYGVIQSVPGEADQAAEITITELGWSVIEQCAISSRVEAGA